MATVKQRLQRFNGSSYDTIHLETEKSMITDFPSSMPASDVYSWAKASSKPSYTYSEVGAAASSHTHAGMVSWNTIMDSGQRTFTKTNYSANDYLSICDNIGNNYWGTISYSTLFTYGLIRLRINIISFKIDYKAQQTTACHLAIGPPDSGYKNYDRVIEFNFSKYNTPYSAGSYTFSSAWYVYVLENHAHTYNYRQIDSSETTIDDYGNIPTFGWYKSGSGYAAPINYNDTTSRFIFSIGFIGDSTTVGSASVTYRAYLDAM